MNKQVFVVCVSAPVVLLSLPVAAREDHCWEVPPDCVFTEARWDKGNLWVITKNACTGRLYIQVCSEVTKASWGKSLCETNGVLPEGVTRQKVQKAFGPTGRYDVKWVGSNRVFEDWVCVGKVKGFSDDPF